MDILTIIKLSIAGVVLIASAVLFLLDLRKKKGFSIFKAACIVAAVPMVLLLCGHRYLGRVATMEADANSAARTKTRA